MEQVPLEPWMMVLQSAVLFASLAAWSMIALEWRRGAPLLVYEPRRPVPWGPIATLPALAFVVLAVVPHLSGDVPPPTEVVQDAADSAQHLLAAILLPTLLAAAVIGVALLSQATAADLGWPKTPRELVNDIAIGLVACLAAVVPVYAVQAALLWFSGQELKSNHPLVKMVSGEGPSVGVLMLATVAAVIAAPVCEEILYRLALQGWLEKVEDEHLAKGAMQNAGNWSAESGLIADATQGEIAGAPEPGNNHSAEREPDDMVAAMQAARGIAGLPHGFGPILGSSALFGVAHFGYGPEPVPIFLLAIIFGYVYQRTHRIVPCIVAHAAFNLLTMVALWGLLFSK